MLASGALLVVPANGTPSVGPASLRPELVSTARLPTAPVGAGSVPTALRTAEEDESTPLSVSLTSMSPSEIPRDPQAVITLRGVVTNDSEEEWADLNVAPFVSAAPITTRSELALAAASATDVAVGERLTDSGTYAAIEDLSPQRSVRFRLRVPVSSLRISGDPGVYWIGVHALGTNSEGRDLVADGRARTFIPLVTATQARQRSVPVSVVLPLRARARRAADGSLNGPGRWAGLTGPEGRLTRLVEFGESAGSTPLSWVVDPAVLDALDDYSRGNPPLSFGTARASRRPADGSEEDNEQGETPAEETEDESPSQEPSPSASPEPAPGTPSQAERDGARRVLDTFVSMARSSPYPLLSLGYADPDVAALARLRPSLVARAKALSESRLESRDLTGTPTVAPPSGYFDPALLEAVDLDSLLLLSDQGRLQYPTLSRLPSGQELVFGDARASAGGPAPTRARDPLGLRQRILAEAALEASKGGAPVRPIVVRIPPGWNPGASWRLANFFGGLERSWVRMSPVPRGATTTFDGELSYARQVSREIGSANVAATRTLARTSTVVGTLLANDNRVSERLTGAALQASAYSAFARPRLAAAQVLALDATVRGQLDRVRVTGSDLITLSGGSGSLTVTLVNGLKQPITVGLRARTGDPEVRIADTAPVKMGPGQRTTLRLQVASRAGIHQVTVYPVTTGGDGAGQPFTFSLRTSQVGELIWYIIAAGASLLVVMILRRILLRIRDHRWRQDEAT